MSEPYYADDQVTLWLGRMEDVLPTLGVTADLIVADPPYGETSLAWDRWPEGWPSLLAGYGRSMWCFGSMRMFLEHRADFVAWRLSQDVVWEKTTSGMNRGDRFTRIHEHVLHWYRGSWSDLHHKADRVPAQRSRAGDEIPRRHASPGGTHGDLGVSYQVSDGRVYRPSVLRAGVASRSGSAINETEKPTGLLEPLVAYGCLPGGLVLDPFAGSCSTLIAARNLGIRAVGIEMREAQCETAARRLAQGCLDLEGAS